MKRIVLLRSKKLVLFSTLSLLLIATPALAKRDNKEAKDTDDSVNINIASPAPTCDPTVAWKNHGEYVSCVAKQQLGGKVTSEAAKSNIGKEDRDDDDDENEASPSPSASPSASPSSSPSASPSASSSASPTPVGIGTSASDSIISLQGTKIELSALIQVLKNIIESLKHLI